MRLALFSILTVALLFGTATAWAQDTQPPPVEPVPGEQPVEPPVQPPPVTPVSPMEGTVSLTSGDRTFELEIAEDGAIELTMMVPAAETGELEEQTFEAANLEEFKTKYNSPEICAWIEEQRALWDRAFNLQAPQAEPPPVEGEVEEGHPPFGIKFKPVDDAVVTQLALPDNQGMLVQYVRKGSYAERAGIMVNDVIRSVDGQPATERRQFRRDIKERLGKKEFPVTVWRNGQEQTLQVKIENPQ